jgi:hypothetical protein
VSGLTSAEGSRCYSPRRLLKDKQPGKGWSQGFRLALSEGEAWHPGSPSVHPRPPTQDGQARRNAGSMSRQCERGQAALGTAADFLSFWPRFRKQPMDRPLASLPASKRWKRTRFCRRLPAMMLELLHRKLLRE